MGKCVTCGKEGAELVHCGRLTCPPCLKIIGHREPMSAPPDDPKKIWKSAVSDFAAWAAETSKICKEHGYYYRCPYCFFVSIDVGQLCFYCRRPKEFVPTNLYLHMPVGWA